MYFYNDYLKALLGKKLSWRSSRRYLRCYLLLVVELSNMLLLATKSYFVFRNLVDSRCNLSTSHSSWNADIPQNFAVKASLLTLLSLIRISSHQSLLRWRDGRTCDTPQNIFAVRPQHHVEVRL